MIETPYILTDVDVLDPDVKYYEHYALVARLCVIKCLEIGERMIMTFDVGSLRTSTVNQIETEDDRLIVTTSNNRYTFTPCTGE